MKKQETYVDLERSVLQKKIQNDIIRDIKQLIKQYPNDKELGATIRAYFIQNKIQL